MQIEMIEVQGGTFTMGKDTIVTLSDYAIGKYPVTQKQWVEIMGNNPSYFKNCDACPVERVSWDDCQEFIRKLNSQTGKRYRLPTEAEWEFAARGGNNSRGYKYSGSNTVKSVAWYGGNSNTRTKPVGTKSPNELGLYDMSGNVWEWCSDWYGAYSSGSQTNPQGFDTGAIRVSRGGSWRYFAQGVRSTYRGGNQPRDRIYSLGFRLAL